jgi:hypothetical protein
MSDEGYKSLEERRVEYLQGIRVDDSWIPIEHARHKCKAEGQAVRCPSDHAVWGCRACGAVTQNLVQDFAFLRRYPLTEVASGEQSVTGTQSSRGRS